VSSRRIRVRVSVAAAPSIASNSASCLVGSASTIARMSSAWWIMSFSSAPSSWVSCISANEIPTSGTAATITLTSSRR
jgi:hypothetical protein